MTGICAIAYMAAGMAADDAVIHAMTTVATGGFSTKDASLGHFNSASVEWIAIVFMFLGSIPFLIYVQMLQGRFRTILVDDQVKAFASFIAVTVVIGWMMAHFSENHVGLEGLRHAAFNVISITTGTGLRLHRLRIVGTACGDILLHHHVCRRLRRLHLLRHQDLPVPGSGRGGPAAYLAGDVSERRVFAPHFNGKPIEDRIIASVMSFFFLFTASFVILSILLKMSGLDTLTALSGAGTALSNVGPGLGEIIGPAGNFQSLTDTQKWLLAGGMLLGRLELFTVLVLFLPRFWRS